MAEASQQVQLDGTGLTPALLRAIAHGTPVEVGPTTHARVAAGRAIVDRYFRDGIAAYGLTTGLGMKASSMLSAEEATAFSYRTVRGRAQALGDVLDPRAVRAVMAVRLNTLLDSGAGASPAVVDALVNAINRGLVPAMRSIGSIGAADLVVMAALPHALIGEGEMVLDGRLVPAAEVLADAGLAPLVLAPKDGLILCNSTAFSTATAALASSRAHDVLRALQISAALSMEGFGANLSPIEPATLRVRPQPGQVEAGDQLRALLVDGPLGVPGSARRLQDPLSFRCVAQTHGATVVALRDLDEELAVDLNASPDNPVVLIDDGRCVSTGNFHLPRLTQTVDTAARSMAWSLNDVVSRIHRLMHAPFTDLTPLLTAPAADSAGFGPLLKPAEALRAEIIHLATPVPILPSHNADGVEDAATFAPLAARKFDDLLRLGEMLVAIELLVACQAIDLRAQKAARARPFDASRITGEQRPLERAYQGVRALSPFIDADRPLGREIEAVATALVRSGALAEAVGLSEISPPQLP